jgi:hypothetical protein
VKRRCEKKARLLLHAHPHRAQLAGGHSQAWRICAAGEKHTPPSQSARARPKCSRAWHSSASSPMKAGMECDCQSCAGWLHPTYRQLGHGPTYHIDRARLHVGTGDVGLLPAHAAAVFRQLQLVTGLNRLENLSKVHSNRHNLVEAQENADGDVCQGRGGEG